MSRKQVLVVEGQEDFLKLESHLLKSQGYAVHAAADCLAAMEYMKKNRPDLVLVDVNLPGCDGFEFCRQVKGMAGNMGLPVVLTSSANNRLDLARGEESGVDGYILKPFRISLFMETVKKALSGEL